MAHIKCPECKKSVSDKAIRCPFCNFVLVDFIAEQNIVAGKCQMYQNTSENRVLKFLRFKWLFDFIDNIAYNLSYIPLVGSALSFVFKILCALALIAIVVGVVGVMFAGLFYVSPLLAIEVMAVCYTIFMYFETYKKRYRSYYFWITLALTILFPIIIALIK